MTDPRPSRSERLLVLAGPATALLATILSLAAGIGLRLPPGGRLGLFGSLEPPHGPLVRPVAGVPPRGLVPIHPLPAPRRARRALRPGVTHRPLCLAPRAGRTGASRSRPGRPLPVAESPSRPAPPRGGVRPGGGGGTMAFPLTAGSGRDFFVPSMSLFSRSFGFPPDFADRGLTRPLLDGKLGSGLSTEKGGVRWIRGSRTWRRPHSSVVA